MTTSKKFIGITDCAKYTNYEQWILNADAKVEVVKLNYHLDNADAVAKCDAILMTGGEDVHPKYYHQPELFYHPTATQFNTRRDAFEWEVVEEAFKLNKPVLGICRGMQLVNCVLKGNLVFDIESSGKPSHRKTTATEDSYHPVHVKKDSLLYEITQVETGTINSAHHQCVGTIADSLTVNCESEDGVPEGLEWKNKDGKAFLLLVQWHPERMNDASANVLSYKIREQFLQRI